MKRLSRIRRTVRLCALLVAALGVARAPATVSADSAVSMDMASAASATAVPAGNRIPWQGSDWYLHGANLPWVNWGCDFGCGSSRGVSDPTVTAQLEGVFQRARDSRMHVVRWWTFEGEAWQVARDQDGAPSAVKPEVYADFDAALALAERYDLYYVFTLFSGPTSLPSGWLTDAAQRDKLAAALGPLFGRYRENPRILAWDVFNEPDWDIVNNKIAKGAVQEMVRAVAAAVHANSSAYVTVAAAMLDGIPNWVGLGLDFYTANWYDYMSDGNWCAFCTTYAEVRARYNLDAPLVIGEFYGGADTNPRTRFQTWYTKGFAGAWAWSLLPESTFDHLAIDLAAAGDFAAQFPDIGPQVPAVSSSR